MAPEFASEIFSRELENDRAVGDYLEVKQAKSNRSIITEKNRKNMFVVMYELHRHKNYREETLFRASNIADRYLAKKLSEQQVSGRRRCGRRD